MIEIILYLEYNCLVIIGLINFLFSKKINLHKTIIENNRNIQIQPRIILVAIIFRKSPSLSRGKGNGKKQDLSRRINKACCLEGILLF